MLLQPPFKLGVTTTNWWLLQPANFEPRPRPESATSSETKIQHRCIIIFSKVGRATQLLLQNVTLRSRLESIDKLNSYSHCHVANRGASHNWIRKQRIYVRYKSPKQKKQISLIHRHQTDLKKASFWASTLRTKTSRKPPGPE